MSDSDDLSWQDDALCRQVDADMFFPEKGGATKDAKSVCIACPARELCLEYALANNEQFGVWGGMSEGQRHRILVDRRKSAVELPPAPAQTETPPVRIGRPATRQPGDITRREAEVLELRRSGMPNAEIVAHLNISPKTLEFYLTAIRKAGHDLAHARPTDTQDRDDTTWDDCGTPAALSRHKKKKIPTCHACLEANRVASRLERARRKVAAA